MRGDPSLARGALSMAIDRVRRRRIDVTSLFAAVLFAVPSLFQPFGHDQAIHFYIGRELLRGHLPYRDAFDYKPPAIYALHALLAGAFGDVEWPIRAADLVAIIALATACWRLLSRRPRGSWGATCLATSIAYYGYFSFWDTAQCELWSVTLAMWSIVWAGRGRALVAGVFLGCAVVTKTPAILFAPIALMRIRSGSRGAGAVALVLGTLVVPTAVVASLAAAGGRAELVALYDALGGATFAYVVGARRVDSFASIFRETVAMGSWFNPYATLLVAVVAGRTLGAVSAGRVTPALRRYGLGLACGLAAFIAVAVQLKFYRYHWVMFVPALVLAGGEMFLSLRARLSRPVSRLAFAMLVASYALCGEPSRWWWAGCSDVVDLLGGARREQVVARYVIPALFYDRDEISRASTWVSAHSDREDLVLVRAFVPEVYVLAHRRAPGRFFWPIPLTDKLRSYHVDSWRDEDRRTIAANPPVVIVVNANVHEGPESAEYFLGLGYERETTIGRLALLKRRVQ